jgi:3-vinyl bacteriochlorophyllide hydratase
LWARFHGALPPWADAHRAAAYAAYVVNAGQFLWKLRMARLEGEVAA